MILNPVKCGYMSFCFNPDKSNFIFEDITKIPSAEEYVVLEVTTDNRLTFYNHLKTLCKKSAKKLNGTDTNCSRFDHNQIRLIYN